MDCFVNKLAVALQHLALLLALCNLPWLASWNIPPNTPTLTTKYDKIWIFIWSVARYYNMFKWRKFDSLFKIYVKSSGGKSTRKNIFYFYPFEKQRQLPPRSFGSTSLAIHAYMPVLQTLNRKEKNSGVPRFWIISTMNRSKYMRIGLPLFVQLIWIVLNSYPPNGNWWTLRMPILEHICGSHIPTHYLPHTLDTHEGYFPRISKLDTLPGRLAQSLLGCLCLFN